MLFWTVCGSIGSPQEQDTTSCTIRRRRISLLSQSRVLHVSYYTPVSSYIPVSYQKRLRFLLHPSIIHCPSGRPGITPDSDRTGRGEGGGSK